MCHAGHVNRALKRALFCTSDLFLLFSASYARHAKARHPFDIKFYGKDKNFTSVVVKGFYWRVAADTWTKRTRCSTERIYAPGIDEGARRINSNDRRALPLSGCQIFWWTAKFDDVAPSLNVYSAHVRVRVKLSRVEVAAMVKQDTRRGMV